MTAVAELHPNDLAMELTGRPYTIWSAITTYQSCPLKYAFRYLENLPEESVSSSLVFGSAIHRGVEQPLHAKNHVQQEPGR
jgi:putative RecB family exonuclease